MSQISPIDLLVLHAVRTMGYADTARVAARLSVTEGEAREYLLDPQAQGWITFSSFAGDGGWSLTESGKAHGERLLAAELDEAGARAAVEKVHRDFLPLNDLMAAACTAWQLAEMGIDDQTVTLAQTITALEGPAAALAGLEGRLTAHLDRFSGYQQRFTEALTKAHVEPAWITGTDRDSCHRVWFELHEDLIATLGVTR
ncbi:transcriptional regulator [Streptomyces sp. NPDC057908]|uniref:transcriptional regulator n=1 Tax=Streptomyces sp. NPDC057908 TaxID=3346276 RepID=UPI0036ECBBA1